jgi:uncharacterized protein with GYD domain
VPRSPSGREKGEPVATYITLFKWTEQGIRGMQETAGRAEAASELVARVGATFTEFYWTLGEYDIVGILEAPDDESAMAALLAIGSNGNARTTTMRAFSRDEMRSILEKVPGP